MLPRRDNKFEATWIEAAAKTSNLMMRHGKKGNLQLIHHCPTRRRLLLVRFASFNFTPNFFHGNHFIIIFRHFKRRRSWRYSLLNKLCTLTEVCKEIIQVLTIVVQMVLGVLEKAKEDFKGGYDPSNAVKERLPPLAF